MNNKPHSEKTKKKMSLSRKRYLKTHSKNTAFKKGQSPWNKGVKGFLGLGKNHPSWRGGKYFDKSGYVYIHKPDHPFCDHHGYVYEHRLVVEEHIGRYLKKEEVVHHQGRKDDNRPDRLMAFVSHASHRRFETGGAFNPTEIIYGRS